MADKDALLTPSFERMEKENEKTFQMIKESLTEQEDLLLSIFERMDVENEKLFENLV